MRTEVLGTMIALTAVASCVMAEENVIVRAVSSCKQDIDTYCRRLNLGEGHIMACLYANDDKISSPCAMALNDVALQSENASKQVSEFIDACETDRENDCPTEEWEDGGVAKCLRFQSYVTESVSTSCRLALKKFGLM